MPKLSLAGHPLHTIINEAPLTLLPFSLVLDALSVKTGRSDYAQAARFALNGAHTLGIAAGAAGFVDYLSIKRGTHEKSVANLHAAMNVTALTLAFASSRAHQTHPTPASLTLLTLANVCVIAGAWYGGNLVYDHGIRVKKAHPLKDAQNIEAPGGEHLKHAFEAAPEHVPGSGPQADEDAKSETDDGTK